MLIVLAVRHLLVHKGRSLLLLLGYGLGVAVMVVLLSVGAAMLEQSRDVALVGGGEVTVLPLGIDVEAIRTGGASGMFFGIDRARFLTRQLLGGPRHAGVMRAVSPTIENKLVYLGAHGRVVPVRAGAELPSRARAVGAGLPVREGTWQDQAEDSAWFAPTRQELYDELDHFHLPPVADSTWAEWHYFNVTVGPNEWWYLTYLVAGQVMRGRWGGQLLVSHRKPDGGYDRWVEPVAADVISLDTARADLALGRSGVRQEDGVYRLRGQATGPAGALSFQLALTPDANRYFPPADLREGALVSGYVVPALSGRVSGEICLRGRCKALHSVPGYHDHNWGVWRGVTWDWGAARGKRLDLLYGAVYAPDDTLFSGTTAPRILVAVVDSLGVRQILRARTIAYHGGTVPTAFSFVASRDDDTLRVSAKVADYQVTQRGSAGRARHFLQMRGTFEVEGTIAGEAVRDEGEGFFETYVGAAVSRQPLAVSR